MYSIPKHVTKKKALWGKEIARNEDLAEIQRLGRRRRGRMDKELMKGSTVTLILHLLGREDMYGYQMIKQMEVRSRGIFTFKEGTLYPILHALEADRLVEAYWSEHEGRKRKYYRITERGKLRLQEKKQEWLAFRSAVDHILEQHIVGRGEL